MINKDNYLLFGLISNLLWAFLVIYSIELKKIEMTQNDILFSMMFFNIVVLGLVSLKNRVKIKKSSKIKILNTIQHLFL